MAFIDMAYGLTGEIPGLPLDLSKNKINEALGMIYDSQYWSFQLKEDNWLTPGLLFPAGSSQSLGTIKTVARYNKIVGDVTAAAQWNAYVVAGTLPSFAQLQIRVPYYSLYNIIGISTTTHPNDTLTLDRNWMEPPGTGQAYMIYQAYFPVPVSDFKRFFAVRDTTNAAPLSYWDFSQRDLAVIDPQRTNFDEPGYVVPYEQDQRAGSATFGNMLYELWPHPLSVLPYTYSYLRRGPLLTANADTVPYPLTEELVTWRAKEVSYLWAEAQKGKDQQRGSGADYRFLAQAANKEYGIISKTVKDKDRDLFDLYYNRFVRDAAIGYYGEPFATIVGGLNVGRF